MKKLYLSFIFIFTICSVLSAQKFYVDSSATFGNNDGTSWTDAYTDLQDALLNVSTGDSIFVSKGIYYPDRGTNNRDSTFAIPDGVVVLGGFDAQNGETTLEDRDRDGNPTILSGAIGTAADTDNSYTVVTSNAVSNTTELDGFYIRDGFADQSMSNAQGNGGGIYNINGSEIALRNLVVENNYANDGGGIANRNASPLIFNVIVQNNTAADNGGGTYANRSSDIGGGGAGATGENSSAQGSLGGSSFSASDDRFFVPAANYDEGYVKIRYNFSVSSSIVGSGLFNCDDLGENTVEVVTAYCDGISMDTCQSIVTLVDIIDPTVIAPADVTLACDESRDTSYTGTATANANDQCGGRNSNV